MKIALYKYACEYIDFLTVEFSDSNAAEDDRYVRVSEFVEVDFVPLPNPHVSEAQKLKAEIKNLEYETDIKMSVLKDKLKAVESIK